MVNLLHSHRYCCYFSGFDTNGKPFSSFDIHIWRLDPHWQAYKGQSSNSAILQASNLFVFTMNNPVMWVEPSGMVAMPVAIMRLGPAATAIRIYT